MPADVTNRVAKALALSGVSPTDPLLVAFSGGRDSVSLVEALLRGGFNKLTLTHLDHSLRPESAAEAAWVKNFALERNLSVVTGRTPVAELAASVGKGLEETARDARYKFFAKVALDCSISKIVLAHHADDQIETLIFRLLRGAGMGGLSAMAPQSERHTDGFSLTLLRPMLAIWRSEIDAFITKLGVPFLEDPSNAKHDFTRNRIRHVLIPEMENVMRRPVREALWRTAEVLRAEGEFLTAAEHAVSGLPENLKVSELKALPIALRRRRVARWLKMQGVSDISYDLVEAVGQLALHLSPAKVNLPKGAHARRKAGLIFYERPPLADPPDTISGP